MSLFGPPDVDKLKKKKDVQGLRKAAKHRDLTIRQAAQDALEVLTANPKTQELIAQAQGTDLNSRIEAARKLGYQQDLQATNSLIEMLEDPSVELRRVVVWSLGFIGDGRARTKLLELLRDPDVEIRANAATALKKVASEDDDIDALVDVLQDESKVREGAARALGSFHQPRAIEALKGLLSDEEWMVRSAAASGLGDIGKRTGDKQVIEILLGVFADENHSVRFSAARDLGDIGAKHYEEDPLWGRVIKELEHVRDRDSSEEVRGLAHGAIVRTLKLQGYR